MSDLRDPDAVLRFMWQAGVDAATSDDFRDENGDLVEEAYLRYQQAAIAQARADLQPEQINYLGMSAVGEWFGVSGKTVAVWRGRYAASHPCPEPDATTGRTPGWLPERKAEWLEWRETLPGQMSGLKRGRMTT